MACIEDRPNCGDANVDATPESFWEVWGWIILVSGIAGGITTVWGNLEWLAGITSGFYAGAAVGFVVAVLTFIVVLNSARDRCTQSTAEVQCVAGVVSAIVASFSSTRDEWLPWQAMHDRVDLVVKSSYWQVVEAGNAYVFCTEEQPPRRSEIMRCYFFEQRVCSAATGAAVGAAIGAVGGIIAAAFIAAAMCVTVVLCVLGLILAAAVAAAAVLGGAAVGGQIAKANSTNEDPAADTGQTLAIGNLVTARGPMEPRSYDDGANVIYWVNSAQLHGNSMSAQPFSYCEINDELAMDGCRSEPVVE